jgi:hypothetical protein
MITTAKLMSLIIAINILKNVILYSKIGLFAVIIDSITMGFFALAAVLLQFVFFKFNNAVPSQLFGFFLSGAVGGIYFLYTLMSAENLGYGLRARGLTFFEEGSATVLGIGLYVTVSVLLSLVTWLTVSRRQTT